MSINIGIIGLSQSGKTTVFNALTSGRVHAESHGLAPHLGIAHVPEPRLQKLADLFHTPKVVFPEAKYIDAGASVKSLVEDKGIGGQLLNQLSTVDTLIIIIRAFKDESIPHPQGSPDIKRDINTLNMELVFSDLAILERRLEKLETSLKGAKSGEHQHLLQEKEILLGFKKELQNDKPLRTLNIESAAARLISNYQFLTAKPALIAVNIDEEQIPQTASMEAELKKQLADTRCGVIAICAKLEMELGQLEEDAAREFRQEYGLKESGLERVIKTSYELSDLITFFTFTENESRAWAITRGTSALKAAGKIHTDMEKGFIRAECIGLEELVECGSTTEARKRGLLRVEGKDYVIQDGDVVTILFNV